MKNVMKFGFTLVAALVLTACGSSDSSESHTSSEKVTHVPSRIESGSSSNSTVTTPSSQSNKANENSNKVVGSEITTGATYVINDTITHSSLNKYSITELDVDGKKVRIGYDGVSSRIWSILNIGDTGALRICCGKYSDMRFGAVGSLNETQNDYIFYNGNPTSTMPNTGTATYNGEAIIAGGANYEQFKDEDYLFDGSSKFNVDFGAKTVKGELNIESLKPISVSASISGNSFNGSASSSELRGNAKVEGKFYGSNAKEMAGMFLQEDKSNPDNSWGGSFGATQ